MISGAVRSLLRKGSWLLPSRPLKYWQGQLIAAACVAGALIFRAAFEPLVGGSVLFLPFFPAILIATAWGGGLAGLSATVAGGLLASALSAYLGTPPSVAAPLWGRVTAYFIVGGLILAVAVLMRELQRALSESEDRASTLAHEMQHRVRNVLGLVQAISRQTARTAATPAEHQKLFEARLVALSRAQDLFAEDPHLPAELKELAERALEPFGRDRFGLQGPPALVSSDTGLSVALLLHELGTNAAKHGALSVPEGSIDVAWQPESDLVRLDWREKDGPAVAPPLRTGFGSRLLRTAFPPELGRASVSFEPDGVRATLHFPPARRAPAPSLRGSKRSH